MRLTGLARRRVSMVVAVGLLAAVVGAGMGAGPAGALDGNIVGGGPVEYGQYPFQAAILALPFGDDDYHRQFCGGSLVAPTFVVTAAHCIDFVGPGGLKLSELKVVVGRTVLTGPGGYVRGVVSVKEHPNYSPSTFINDVGIIQLDRPINGITPIKMATTGTDALERPGRLATITGWGNTRIQDPDHGLGGVNYPNRMQVGQVPIVADDECVAAYESIGPVSPEREICAGRSGKDTCQGDSGGPMFVAVPGGFRQIGITSSGEGCGAIGFPGIYTQVSSPPIGNFITRAIGGTPP